ncbi:MAG: septation protein SepH, partial [Microlunatus sp.]
MESVLSPREIQTRIRSGESVAEVARVAGMDLDRVERFAAPVIAEREHVAGLAMTSSARRRGETSSHRTLRGVLNERLLSRGIDADSVRWDSFRLEDGRWSVTADYDADGTPHQAQFFFDLPGRYSVAGNDEGRWILGDARPGSGPGSLVEGYEEGAEPTVDLSDELALVRLVQDVPVAPPTEPETERAEATVTRLEITEIEVTSVEIAEADEEDRGDAEGNQDTELETEVAEVEAVLDLLADGESGLDTLYQMFEDQDPLNLG